MRGERGTGIFLAALGVTLMAFWLLYRVCIPTLPVPPATTSEPSCTSPETLFIPVGLLGIAVFALGVALLLHHQWAGRARRAVTR